MSRLIFMGTPVFSVPVLETLAIHHHVLEVITPPDKPVGRGKKMTACPVKQAAERLNIPVLSPEKLHTQETLSRIRALKPDFIVVVAYGKILRSELLQIPSYGCINIHASLLPKFRGASPIQSAILAGDIKTGITTMQMAPEMDAGDVYLQEVIPILDTDTSLSLHDQLSKLGAKCILPTLQGIEANSLQAMPQNHATATYCSKITKEMGYLIPTEAAIILDRKVRAFHPWPGTRIMFHIPLIIRKARAVHNIFPMGALHAIENQLFLGTINGSLELQVVQLENKTPITAGEFIHRVQQGSLQQLPWQVTNSDSL